MSRQEVTGGTEFTIGPLTMDDNGVVFRCSFPSTPPTRDSATLNVQCEYTFQSVCLCVCMFVCMIQKLLSSLSKVYVFVERHTLSGHIFSVRHVYFKFSQLLQQ